LVRIAMAVGLVVAAGVAYKHWQDQKAAQAAADADAAAQAEAVRQHALVPAALPEATHPWKNLPKAARVGEACIGSFKKLKALYPAGWTFRDAVCTSGGMTVTWMRPDDGRVDYFQEVEPSATFTPDYKLAQISVPFQIPVEPEEALVSGEERARFLTDFAVRMRLTAALGSPTRPPLPNQPANNKTPQLANWTEQSVRLDNFTSPLAGTVETMDGPGFRVASIQITINNALLNYTLQGVQYGNP
jgi:hypothetical protein